MTQVINTSSPFTASLPQAISNLDLMMLIGKINLQFELFSNSLNHIKREQDSIFNTQSHDHKNLKMREGMCILATTFVIGAAGVGGHFTSDILKNMFKTISATASLFGKSSPPFFAAYETLISSKKHIAQTEADALKNADDRLTRQVSSNIDSLKELLRQLGSLNHLR